MLLPGGPAVFLGRRAECALFDRWQDAVRSGRGGALVVLGEPGIGKSALLDHMASTAAGFRVVRAAGVEAEAELPFGVLHQVCAPLMTALERLPEPQQNALAAAFGLRTGPAPDRFMLGLAVLGLLSEAATRQPVICVIDDAQWLDSGSAQALAFVAHRVGAEPLGLVFATRGPVTELEGLQEMVLTGLGPGDSRALLHTALYVPLDERIVERIAAEARGNPLALLELPKTWTAAQFVGGFGPTAHEALPTRIEDSFLSRALNLPPATRMLLLVAASEPTGDSALLWRAAGRLGIGPSAATAAETDGLLSIGTQVVFRHPLVRSAIYRAASPSQRRAAHRALADATGPSDPDRRAWHDAQAASGFDEEAATELEGSADRALARGGLAAAGAFLERAVELTADPALMAERALRAARAKQQAGAYDSALHLLAVAEQGPADALRAANSELLRGQIALAQSFGGGAAAALLCAARRFESIDASRARDVYLQALAAAVLGGRLGEEGMVEEVARSARRVPPPSVPRAPDLLLDGLTLLITEGRDAAVPLMRRAVSAFTTEELAPEEELYWLWLAGHCAGLLWDEHAWQLLSSRLLRCCQQRGALSILPIAAATRSGLHLLSGELVQAASLAETTADVFAMTGAGPVAYAEVGVAVFRGRAEEALAAIRTATRDATVRGEGMALTYLRWGAAVLHNSMGRYDLALDAARLAGADSSLQRMRNWALSELVEAAVRSGHPELADEALQELCRATSHCSNPWAAGLQAYCQALLATGADAQDLYRTALDQFEHTSLHAEVARTHLLYGEWLRRERHHVEARDHLREAHEMFLRFGMERFADRARNELSAAGEPTSRRPSRLDEQLTTQERRVAMLAAEGATNAEIASRLFISASTVDYHLRKVFRKFKVTTRTQLARLLQESQPAPEDTDPA
ncbi:helix-turn-helix transcriptional regulator [Streptacidiphilus griseoplanus]|uniref:helix-turn-helix transcriptional regulator n=1 Tax=Peterkaempfera griseoplana TaxID=66896 RepID=UPI0006E249D1|nr:LuxR family transcriptional regulator [Peterkaempfera griseoplana]